ncbi:MAG: polymerase sigma-70 factor, subfamily [Candidatus Adlerbacteria bacterium]|nr:polymerase sigma-70 factor, subfamily [Candidatus Adlerbacteria bacterium]
MKDTHQDFAAAFEAHADELFRHAAMRLSDRERAVELTQEAFIKAWEYVNRGEEVREYRPFLFRVLRNLIIDEYRRHTPVSLEGLAHPEEGHTIEDILPADDSNTLDKAMDRFEAGRAVEALAMMPEPYKEVLTMRFIDGFTPKEIAQMLDETENVVSVRIHRGVKKLREALEAPPQETQ